MLDQDRQLFLQRVAEGREPHGKRLTQNCGMGRLCACVLSIILMLQGASRIILIAFF